MKTNLATLSLLLAVSFASANTAPTPVIVSAAMRPGTTLMDVVYRVNDPDDATVKTRALAFISGTRSFSNVIKPTAFVEGTAANLGDAIATNTNKTLTWDVAVDWSIDVGQLKFEILALDSRGLVQFDWIAIPAADGYSALTISKDTPTTAKVLDALFWQYASGDTGLTLASGVLKGTAASGNFSGLTLANGSNPDSYWSTPYLLKKMNIDPATSAEVTFASLTARAGLLNTSSWHAANRGYAGIVALVGWGGNSSGELSFPTGINGIVSISSNSEGGHFLALNSDGTVVAWGTNSSGQTTVPTGLTGVTAISAGANHSLALKSDGTVVAWGNSGNGPGTVPTGLSGVVTIGAGYYTSFAVKSDGTVVAWGNNSNGQTTVPAGLSGVTAIASGYYHSVALKSDGTVVAWGSNSNGQTNVPVGLSGVTAIAVGNYYSLALKSDGTVVGWGANLPAVPAGLSGVTAIAAGSSHCLALKSDGTVVAWGSNGNGQTSVPTGLSAVTAIAAGLDHSIAFKAKAP